VYSQAEVTERIASGLTRLKSLLPVKLIALLGPCAREDGNSQDKIELLVLYEGASREDAPALVKEALDITGLEPHVFSSQEYAYSKKSLDAHIAKGIVLFQEGSSGRRSQDMNRGWRRRLRWIGNGLVAAGLLIIFITGAYYGYSYYSLSQIEQEADLSQLAIPVQFAVSEALAPGPVAPDASDLASFLASGPGETKAVAPRTSTIGDDVPWEGLSSWPLGVFPPLRVIIPSINVDSKIIETGIVFEDGEWQWERPKNAVGHLKGTGEPGQSTNMVLSGHISSPQRGEGDVFRRLPDVKIGDIVVVYTEVRAFTYQIISKKVVLPTEIDVLKPTTDETVTLITCVPDLIYSHRLIVTAKRVSPS